MTHSVEQFVKQSDNSSNLSDIHTSVALRAVFTFNQSQVRSYKKIRQLKRAKGYELSYITYQSHLSRNSMIRIQIKARKKKKRNKTYIWSIESGL